MKQQNIFDFINVDGLSLTPKYIQLANSIQDAVSSGKIKSNWILPSLHELTYHLEISKETADRGYKYLRDLGVLSSVPGKGHYVTAKKVVQPRKIFLLLDKLNAGRKTFYDVFSQVLGDDVTIDFYIYNDDYELFKKLLNRRREGYSHYVILPHFAEGGERAHELLNTIPKDKLILLDQSVVGVDGDFGSVSENFKRNIYKAMETVLEDLSKYDTIRIISSSNINLSADLSAGFNLFCQQYAFERSIEQNVQDLQVKKGEVFICLHDDDLVTLIEMIRTAGLEVGEDVGIISYNETPLKRYILKGITTISTDFEQMGIKAAKMVLKNQMEHVELDCRLKLRHSL
ncbi:substrate-binding domain-containing protein [Mucilaginibacter mali]|uniref:Substrate-binding domain-containing protein n=1 Tax=Mucilaginibacter mali TaxID=2740462 RepID=A0A7D4PYX9_9SPHI|nr:substrate-binding domain-containing protein [Mucilaginibacter mali]QKJ28506.1 substrate-binding domain-containing protein [Mucilaginibacter mali]